MNTQDLAVSVHRLTKRYGHTEVLKNVNMEILLKNPKILADYMESNLRIVTPFFEELFLEGIQDGSIPDIKYPKALASLFVMITSVWFIPSIVPCTQEDLLERLLLTKHMLDSMGIYLIDDEILQHAQTIVQSIPTK